MLIDYKHLDFHFIGILLRTHFCTQCNNSAIFWATDLRSCMEDHIGCLKKCYNFLLQIWKFCRFGIQQQIGFITLAPMYSTVDWIYYQVTCNSPQQRVFNSNSIPPPIPSGLISNERKEHSTTDFGPRFLHRNIKSGSLTKNIPSIPKPNESNYSKIPIPATSWTFPNNSDIKNIPNSPQSANRSSAKHSRTNECPNQSNKVITYFMKSEQ